MTILILIIIILTLIYYSLKLFKIILIKDYSKSIKITPNIRPTENKFPAIFRGYGMKRNNTSQ